MLKIQCNAIVLEHGLTNCCKAKNAAFSLASFWEWHWGPCTNKPLDNFTWQTVIVYGIEADNVNKYLFLQQK